MWWWLIPVLAFLVGFVLGAVVMGCCLYDLVLRIQDAQDEGLRF
jgi:uncharacterized membrane-anchored protein YhcB (DUF1043 family)